MVIFSKPVSKRHLYILKYIKIVLDRYGKWSTTGCFVVMGILYAIKRYKRDKEVSLLQSGRARSSLSRVLSETALRFSKRLLARGAEEDERVGINARFLQRLKVLLPILIPHWRSKEALIIGLLTFFYMARTVESAILAHLDGIMANSMVSGKGRALLIQSIYFFVLALPSVYTNSMMKYLQGKLSLAFRTRLTQHLLKSYLSHDHLFYKVVNLDDRIDHPDQRLTQDIAKFSDAVTSVYGNFAKPLLDTIFFAAQLVRHIGFVGSFGNLSFAILSGVLLRRVAPPFGKLAAQEAHLEGNFRAAHASLIANSEEIAFYGGENVEHAILNFHFRALCSHLNHWLRSRIGYDMLEDIAIKYAWSASGYIVGSFPIYLRRDDEEDRPSDVVAQGIVSGPRSAVSSSKRFLTAHLKSLLVPNMSSSTIGDKTQMFIVSKRLMLNLADAGGRLVYSYRELAELAGYTARVSRLLEVFSDIHQYHHYEKYQLQNNSVTLPLGDTVTGYSHIVMQQVPLVTPQGETLLDRPALSFAVQPGQHCLITGPNGCGKTTVVRVLAGLWPLYQSADMLPEDDSDTVAENNTDHDKYGSPSSTPWTQLMRPMHGDMMCLPQRPYLSLGSLRDQVIYPDTHDQCLQKGYTDDDLLRLLTYVHLDYMVEREGGWTTVKNWSDVLSGGEKQKVAMARLFYHQPRFAILDEATSAVSAEAEGSMYRQAKDMGMTLLTVSHRPSLFKYHQYVLRLGVHDQSPPEDHSSIHRRDHGDVSMNDHTESSAMDGLVMKTTDKKQQRTATWEFNTLDTHRELRTLEDEMAALKWQLQQLPKVRHRLDDIDRLLLNVSTL